MLLVVASLFILAGLSSGEPGGWIPIELTDVRVVETAEFAVSEHNKESGSTLVFTKLIGGEKQRVAGWVYKLAIEAKDGKENLIDIGGKYSTIVWENEKGKLELMSFEPLLQ